MLGLRKYIALLLWPVIMTACGRSVSADAPGVIWDAGDWAVSVDQVTVHGVAVQPDTCPVAPDTIGYQSSQPVIDFAFNNVVASLDRLPEHWCYDVDFLSSLAQSMAIVAPGRAADMLRAASERCIVTDGSWPLTTSRAEWIEAAWQVYLATGDVKWLEEMYEIGQEVIERDIDVALSQDIMLFAGLLDRTADAVKNVRDETVYALKANVVHVRGLRVLHQAALLLDRQADAARYSDLADKIAVAVNDRFWIPQFGRYGDRLTGDFYPVVSAGADHEAAALAVLYDVASPEMSRSIVSNTPVTSRGVPPQWLTASARVGNEKAILFSIGSVMAGYYGSMSMHDMDISSMAGAIDVVTKSLLGLRLTAEGLAVRPQIPGKLAGSHRLMSMPYRNMVIDLEVNGSGDRMARFEIDGVASDKAIVPDTLTGRHKVTVTMANNEFAPGEIRFMDELTDVGSPAVQFGSDGRGRIIRRDNALNYSLMTNGVETFRIMTDTFRIDLPDGFTVAAVTASDDDLMISQPSKARLYIPENDSVMVFRSSLQYDRRVKPQRRRNSRRKPLPDHLEMSRILNTQISFTVNAPAAGLYFVDLGYWRPMVSESLLTDLYVDGRRAGTFVMSAHTGTSNALTVSLVEGQNSVRLIHRPLPASTDDGAACLEYIRFIRK